MSKTFTLLSTSNFKTRKGEALGYLTFNLNLAPSTLSGVMNTCPKATAGCRAACLNTAGRGGMFRAGETVENNTNTVQEARKRKTRYFFQAREAFMLDLVSDIRKAVVHAEKKGMIPVIRLNNTSDILWERIPVLSYDNIFQMFKTVQFYDYTKILNRRGVSHLHNYHLTFSRGESNEGEVRLAIEQGYNIAVVFSKLPETYMGRPVINGDESDLRMLDPTEVIVGLKAKGRARKDTSGFVVHC
jgi:hypothetical protein